MSESSLGDRLVAAYTPEILSIFREGLSTPMLVQHEQSVSRYRLFVFTGPIDRDAVEAEWLRFE